MHIADKHWIFHPKAEPSFAFWAVSRSNSTQLRNLLTRVTLLLVVYSNGYLCTIVNGPSKMRKDFLFFLLLNGSLGKCFGSRSLAFLLDFDVSKAPC